MRSNRSTLVPLVVFATLSCASLLALAQKSTPADAAEKLTGTWKVNRALSPSIGRGRGVAAGAAPRVGLAAFQRGGRGAEPAAPQDLTPDQIAGRAAIRQLQQIPETLKIVATPDQITFTEARGVSSFPINNKGIKIDVGDIKRS